MIMSGFGSKKTKHQSTSLQFLGGRFGLELVRRHRDFLPAKQLLPELLANYEAWERDRYDVQMKLFTQVADRDGMEGAIGGYGYRPTINSYMYGDAIAIARIADLCSEKQIAETYRDKAADLKERVQSLLWNKDHEFFEIREAPCGFGLFEWRLNDDDALTRSAKISSSANGRISSLNDVLSQGPRGQVCPTFQF